MQTKKQMNKWFTNVIFFVLGVTVGVLSLTFKQNPKFTPSTKEIRLSNHNYQFINPLLECEVYDDVNNVELKSFKAKIEKIVDSQVSGGNIKHASVYFRDLNNGPWFGINERENFSPASLLKVPIMMAYLKEAEKDPDLLKRELKYDGPDYNNLLTFKPSKPVVVGEKYVVDDLLYRMIALSDNNADKVLVDNLGESALTSAYKELGIDIPTVRTPEDFMNIKTYAAFFRILFNASFLSRDMSEKGLGYLTKSEFMEGLKRGVPTEIFIAHKFGERVGADGNLKQLHDCGIVYYPNRPYLLCVMTRGNDFDKLSATVSIISEKVYSEVSSQLSQKSNEY